MQQPSAPKQATPAQAPSTTAPISTAPVILEQRDALPVLRISNRHADAVIALQGAQVLEYTPRGAHPVIWLSERAEYARGQSQRGGIPVCWPWFGALERNPQAVRTLAHGDRLPAHGLARTRDWSIRSLCEHEHGTEIILHFVTDSTLQQQWPHAAELQLRVTVGKSLRLALTTRNLDAQPITITQALHTYFAISAIGDVHLSGLDDSRYIDTLDDWHEYNQSGAIYFSGETDRIYLGVPRSLQLHDAGWQRTLHLRTQNSASAVVWNPWIEKSQRLSQFAPDAWRDMVCIETANVLDDRIELAPQAAHTLMLEIEAEY